MTDSYPPRPGPGEQPQYGAPQYGAPYYTAPQNSQDAVVALVLAIGGWVICPVILSIVALVFAGKAQQAIAGSGGALTGAGIATAAKVLAWIEIVLFLVGVVVFLGFVVAVRGSKGS